MSEEKESVLKLDRRRRDVMRKTRFCRTAPLTADEKGLVLKLVGDGATLAECVLYHGIPSYDAIWQTTKNDPEFGAAYAEARARGVSVQMETAKLHAEEVALTRDPDQMRVATQLAQIAALHAEKVAPKEYGALVKLAGADGGPLTVQVVNYAQAITNGGHLSAIATTIACDQPQEQIGDYTEVSGEGHSAATTQRDAAITD